MIYVPEKYKEEPKFYNDKFLELRGTLGDKEAKIELAKFLRSNLTLTVKLLTGIKLYPFQEVLLHAFLNKNYCMNVLSRGAGKTFLGGLFCILQTIFEPNSNIIICGPTFRTSKFIFQKLEDIVIREEASMLRDIFLDKNKRNGNDLLTWKVNGGTIRAVPLSGEKLRGFRANILLIDEYLLMPKEIIDTVLMPFLIVPQDLEERQKIREIENNLILDGKMKEADRVVFKDKAKLIGLSSASYTFENLYRTYQNHIDEIHSPLKDNEKVKSKYFTIRLSYQALPKELWDDAVIDAAKKESGELSASFRREYCAEFVDESDSYFSMKKMVHCTIENGHSPTVKYRGDKDKKYILTIDPSYSSAEDSDYFAMGVYELLENEQKFMLVHTYKSITGQLSDHIKYVKYICNNFNIVLGMIDNASFNFLESCNESAYFSKNGFNVNLDFSSNEEGVKKIENLRQLKSFLETNIREVPFIKQKFQGWVRDANEYLQDCIDRKRVVFAGQLMSVDSSVEKIEQMDAAGVFKDQLKLTPHKTLFELIEEQDEAIIETKKQCATIEVRVNALGNQSFDVPNSLKKGKNKMRRDNYTCLLMGAWLAKTWYELQAVQEQRIDNTFTPVLI